MTQYSLRLASADDSRAIASVIARAFEAYRGQLIPPSSSLDKTPAAVENELRTARAIVAAMGADLVGCVFFKSEADGVYLSRLAVMPEQRGRGLATDLIKAVEQQAVLADAKRIYLSVRLVLTDLRAFYERLGYLPESYGVHAGFSEPTFVNLAKPLKAVH